MRPRIFVFFLLAYQVGASAQDGGNKGFEYPKHQITVSFMDMIDPFAPSFLLGYEQFISNDFSLLAEGGPVSSFDGRYLNQNQLEGYKLRGEVRYNFDFQKERERYYLGLQVMYRHTTKKGLTGNFCRFDCIYFQELDYFFVKDVTAGHLSIGFSSAVTDHLLLEIGGFAGFRFIEGQYGGVPSDASLQSDVFNFTFDQEGNNLIPSIGLTFKLGFGW